MPTSTYITVRTDIIKRLNGYGKILTPTAAAVVFSFVCSSTAHAKPADSSVRPLIPSQMTATVGTSEMTFVDQKTGLILWKANVAQSEAQSISSGAMIGEMRQVDGILYSHGHPADHLQAPNVSANNGSKIVTATGGVKITSLTQAATAMTCDKVIWFTSEDRMVGLGHVVFHTGGFTQTSPSFLADTKLKNVIMPAPGNVSQTKVHVTFGAESRKPKR